MKLRTATLLVFLTAGARSEVEHKTRFDSEMVPGIRGQEVTFPLSNSRQLVRTSGGQWLLVFDAPADGLYICYGPPGRTEGSRFSPPLLMVGNGKEGVLAAGVRPAGVSLAIAGDLLFLAWSDQSGLWAARISLPRLLDLDSLARALRQARPAELVSSDGAMGDIAIDASGRPVLAWSSESGVFISIDSAGHWQAEKAAPSGNEPVVEFDKAGRLHMAYRYQREVPFFGRTAINPRIYYTVREKQGWRPSELAAQGLSFHPAMALDSDRPIVGFQHEGMKAVSRAGDRYLDEREGGGASIGYAAYTDSAWQTGFVSQAHEIITRDSTVADAYKGRIYPMVEQKWRPRMAIDKYGVPWVFWPDTTRRHTYFARWLGSAFSDEYECRGGYYAPSEYITVEKRMPASASEIGFAYAAGGRLYFGTQPVPSATIGDSRHFLFLDLLDFSEMRGVDQVLNRFTKSRQNPVFGPGDPGSWDDYGISFPNVRYDRGKFMMEYSGHGIGGTAGAWNHGYAESQDGIHWSRPKLGLTESKGSRDNNLIPWVPNFLDKKEPDPGRRYKGGLVDEHWITDFSRRIAYSADAIHWTYGQETVNLTSMLEGAGPCFRDELDIPERRFKSVGRTLSQGHRALGMMWSPDLIHWYGDEAILDVEHPYDKPALQWRGRYVAGRILDPSAEKGGDQIYWGTVWIENGIYLCLYAPFQYDGGYQGGLAMSRDGVNVIQSERSMARR